MKKVLVALAMILGVGSSVAFAQEANDSTVAVAQVPQDDFVKLNPAELPQAVMQTLTKEHPETLVKEAYVKGKDEAKVYKVIIAAQDGTETTLVFSSEMQRYCKLSAELSCLHEKVVPGYSLSYLKILHL